MADGRILIASSDDPYAASPTWERFDNISNCRSPGYDLSLGRDSIFEQTDVGTASVLFNDRAKVLDTDDLVGRAIQLQVQNPLDGLWYEEWRGVIDEPDFDVHNSGVKATVSLKCVDMFAYLASVELLPGVHGDAPPSGYEGQVFYEDGPVNLHLEKLMLDARIADVMAIIFEGNVDVVETLYAAGDPIILAIRDACDAEFPGIANCYIDRKGRFCFHGRYARFTPDSVAADAGPTAWDFQRWKGGDGAAIAADDERAQVRAFSHNRPRSRIYNAAIAWPRWKNFAKSQRFEEKDKPAQVVLDTASRNKYGYRAFPAMGDLIIDKHKTNGNTGPQECRLFAEFYVQNQKVPRKNVNGVTFKAIHPDDPRAAALWPLLCKMDVSDMMNLSVAAAGVSDQWFHVEGIRKTVRVLNPEFDYIEVTPSLSPESYYDENVFD